MFFRTKQIKGTPLLQLVEAYRNPEGQPRQRVLASLGNATLPAGDPRHLVKAVEYQINGQDAWLDGTISTDAAGWVVHVACLAKRSKGATQAIGGTVIDGVLLDEIQTEQVVELGPQLVAMKAWDALGFTPMLQNLGMNPTAIVAHPGYKRNKMSASGGVLQEISNPQIIGNELVVPSDAANVLQDLCFAQLSPITQSAPPDNHLLGFKVHHFRM